MPADTQTVQLNIRIPVTLNAALEAEAEKERRSKNAQAIVILEEWLREHLATPAKTPRKPQTA